MDAETAMNFDKNIISVRDMDRKSIEKILLTAKKIEDMPKNEQLEIARGHTIASLFFEPSTRTMLSFDTAAKNLGCSVIGFSGTESTSVKKGETLADTIRMASAYSDLIVLRHPFEGSSRRAADVSAVPIINAGDGANQHPTQTLLDLYTILKTKGTLDNLTIALAGDLKYGRTIHSLTYALSFFNNNKLLFVAPKTLGMPKDLVAELDGKIETKEATITEALRNADILYMTRIQKERFLDPQEYEQLRGTSVLTKDMLENAKKGLKVMHPLPRVDEISTEVDSTENAIYFTQAKNGVPVRMALIAMLLEVIK